MSCHNNTLINLSNNNYCTPVSLHARYGHIIISTVIDQVVTVVYMLHEKIYVSFGWVLILNCASSE